MGTTRDRTREDRPVNSAESLQTKSGESVGELIVLGPVMFVNGCADEKRC